MDPLETFFREIDAALNDGGFAHFDLRIVGSTALFLQSDYRRGTNDSDVVETYDFDPALRVALLQKAGRGSVLATRHALFLQFIGEVILFLPDNPTWTPWLSLEHMSVLVLAPTDVVVAKLIRLHGDDVRDIEAMISRDLVSHREVVARFKSAAARLGNSGQGHKLGRAISNLHRVERDLFAVAESEIEIPDWMLA